MSRSEQQHAKKKWFRNQNIQTKGKKAEICKLLDYPLEKISLRSHTSHIWNEECYRDSTKCFFRDFNWDLRPKRL